MVVWSERRRVVLLSLLALLFVAFEPPEERSATGR